MSDDYSGWTPDVVDSTTEPVYGAGEGDPKIAIIMLIILVIFVGVFIWYTGWDNLTTLASDYKSSITGTGS